ncbi:MAG: TIGR03960 family B12-binding radical SAM protein [Leptospirales bacterium]|nr:TIGR03960 family B12-binding radical SAM protein [Leptospirales bacterium]
MKTDFEKIERALYGVQKPARYTGAEIGSVLKSDAVVRAALSYPDMYEIGMSNNGIKILYELANAVDGIACERVFSAAEDFESLLLKENIPLFTLESHTPLNELDLLGFNLAYELLYTNMLRILELGHIPLLRTERDSGSPIIIAGGSAVSNPFPVSDFVDVFFIGDGEEGFIEILNSLAEAKKMSLRRGETIERLGSIEGVLLPHLYDFEYDGMSIVSVKGPDVKKRTYKDFKPPETFKPLVPNIRVEHEKAVLNVNKGCYNLCKFCHAGYFELPYRSYPAEDAAAAARGILANTGYNELSLSSLSIGDYRELNPLLNTLLPELTRAGISISLPSLRVDAETISLIESVSDIRKSSLTFAVESGSERLRLLANKDLEEDELLLIIGHVFANGWNLIKLYFMLGLPGCEDEDEAEAIIALLKKITALGRGKKEIHVTLSPFIPKPHTPFQRSRQMDDEYFLNAVVKIKKSMPRSVKIKSHNVRASVIEGVLSRGDSRLGAVILNAYRNGCRFDSWNEHFKYDVWLESLDSLIPRWRDFFNERKGELPWQNVLTGKEKLTAALSRRVSKCRRFKSPSQPIDTRLLSEALEDFHQKYNVAQTIRLKFSKTGIARFIPHIDFTEIVKRAARRAALPAAFTQGFNKRERIAMGPALPLGIESLDELCDISMYAALPVTGAPAALSAFLPSGIEAVSASEVTRNSPKLSEIEAAVYEVEIHDERLRQKAALSLAEEISFVKQTKSGEKSLAFGDVILSHTTGESGVLSLTVKLGSMRIDSLALALAQTGYENIGLFRILKVGHIVKGELLS